MLAVVGGETAFAQGRALQAGVAVSVKAVERQAEAIGSDLATQAESDRCQAAPRAFPPQRGASIATLYIEMDAKGRPVRDAHSTTYTGAIGDAEAFGQRIYHEAWRRGLHRAERQIVIGDGAAWI